MIQQGHRYGSKLWEVLALESKASGKVRVAVIDRTQAWPLVKTILADCARLKPLPMRYFHGETPK